MIIVLILSIIGITLILNCIKNIDASESPLIACSLIIVYVYIFALLGLLEFGAFSALVLGLGAILVALFIKRKNLKEYFGSLLKPGYIYFILLMILMYPICKPIVTGAWDEYSHWALIVRNMLLTNHLPVQGGAVTYLSYPPATAIFQYLFVRFSSGAEGMMYYAQMLLISSCLGMMLKGQKFRKPIYLLFMIVLPIAVIIKFSQHNIFNIFTDTIMALVAISCLISYFDSKHELSDVIKIAPILFVLCLIRPSAISFAVFCVIIIIWHYINTNGFELKKVLYVLGALVIPIITAVMSWRIHTKLIGIIDNGSQVFPIDVPRLNATFHNFIRAIFLQGVGNIPSGKAMQSSTFAFFAMSVGVLIIMSFVFDKEQRKEYNPIQLSFIVCFVLYTVGMLYSYLYAFSAQEGIKVAAFSRYMSSYFMFWIIGVFYVLLRGLKEPKMKTIMRAMGMIVCAAIIAVIVYFTNSSMQRIFSERRIENLYEEGAKECACDIQSTIGTESKVYLIFQKSSGFTFMGTRYQLGTNQTNLGTWSLGEPYYDSDVWTVNVAPEGILRRFVEFDYVYIAGGGDEQLWNKYGMLFDKPDSGYKIFKVTPDGDYPLTAVID